MLPTSLGTRSRLRWAIAIPLVLAGTAAAHGLAYVVAFPSASARSADLEASGHGYLDQLPLALALLFGLLLVGLAANVSAVVRRTSSTGAPAWLFATLPPLVFAIQEHLERYIHTGHFPLEAALEPSFAIGLALQLPFALLALVVARLLTRAAEALGGAIVGQQWQTLTDTPSAHSPRAVFLPRLPALAAGVGTRGPPLS